MPSLAPLSEQNSYIVVSPINSTDSIEWYYQNTLQSGQTNDSLFCVGAGNYYCIVTNSCGSATSNTININTCTTEITETSNINIITIYPNPTNGLINIKANGLANETCQLVLRNTLGQILNEKVFQATYYSNETQLDLKAFPIGVYFLTVSSNNIKYTYKVQKQ
ncbi:MAG: T9SS type A sorting domain-containing protein [Bacteroidetes bacterium]|nr:T9SS type A sorting domain-containing protein [Bacteroidota bacterium]